MRTLEDAMVREQMQFGIEDLTEEEAKLVRVVFPVFEPFIVDTRGTIGKALFGEAFAEAYGNLIRGEGRKSRRGIFNTTSSLNSWNSHCIGPASRHAMAPTRAWLHLSHWGCLSWTHPLWW